jgi:hypothetical protein
LVGIVKFRAVSEESFSYFLGLIWSMENLFFLKKLSFIGIVSKIECIFISIERYVFWNNAGFGCFFVGGDLDGTSLGLEKSIGFELGFVVEWECVILWLNGFHYDYENFIFLQEIFVFIQRVVEYIEWEVIIQGFEVELDLCFWQSGSCAFQLMLMGDYVNGHNDIDDEFLPRILLLRLGGCIEFIISRLIFGLEVWHSFA